MDIAVIGTGYVGLVTGTCLAEHGHHVICVDTMVEKIAMLWRGEMPIYEPGLSELVAKNQAEGRLSFTVDTAAAVAQCPVVMIAVGTPPGPEGEADLTAVKDCAVAIGRAMTGYRTVVVKSTVPVGTGDLISRLIAAETDHDFDVVSNPEFLREGTAVYDALHPDRIVVGAEQARSFAVMEELYRSLKAPFVLTDRRSSEMIKYASNAFLAVKISFINEIAGLCERLGADVTEVARGMGFDKRIGAGFLRAGLGYGGSCFPKDTQALVHMGKQFQYELPIVQGAMQVNQRQRAAMLEKVYTALGACTGKRVAVLGLAFKPNTDDVREAPAFDLMLALVRDGAEVTAFDPLATPNARAAWTAIAGPAERGSVRFCESALEAIQGADAVVVATEWPEFASLNWEEVRRLMAHPVVLDGRNCLDGDHLRELGFAYAGVGLRHRFAQ